MRKVPVVPAALGAVLILMAVPSLAEPRPAGEKRHPAHPAPRTAPRTAAGIKTLIRQNDAGEVVIDRVDVAGMSICDPAFGRAAQLSAPLEPADTFARPPPRRDIGRSETPKSRSPKSAASRAAGNRSSLSRIAKRVGSFLRPKSSLARMRPEDVDLDALLSGGLLIPVEGVDVEKLRDSFLSQRGKYAQHLAIDIGAPRGTPVLATTDGQIVRISREQRGGKSLYQKDASGKYLLFYCHLSGYAKDSRVGQEVHKGDVIGYVGSTGHVIGGSHLHFSITRLPADGGNFKAGLAINPYLLFLAGP